MSKKNVQHVGWRVNDGVINVMMPKDESRDEA